MEDILKTSGPVFDADYMTNLFYLHELFGNIAQGVSKKMQNAYDFDIPLTSGLWGGTYLISTDEGKCKRKVWRLYCIVTLPPSSPLDQHKNLERLIEFYYKGFAEAFKAYDMDLDLKQWGGTLPYSNNTKPSLTLHMVDARKRIHWLRAFFVWNVVPWEESIIYDTVRLINILKEWLDPVHGPVFKEPVPTRFFLQDVIIAYRTLEGAGRPEFIEHAGQIIEETTLHFLLGLHNPKLIQELYLKVFESGIWRGLEDILQGAYGKAGLDIYGVGDWPVEKINWVPDELRDILAPPLTEVFTDYKINLDKKKLDSAYS